MQIQKHLFRIAERALKSSKAPLYWKIIMFICLVICLYLTIAFIIGTYFILPSNNQLSECFQKSIDQKQKKFEIQSDGIYMVFSKDLGMLRLKQAKQNNQIVADNQLCTIIKGMNMQNFNEKPFQFTWTPNVLYFDSIDRQTYKFTNYTILFKQTPFTRYIIYGMNNLLTNQLITNPLNIFPPNPFIKSSTLSINSSIPSELSTKQKIIRVAKAILYYFIISIVTSLYIYGTIIAAPAVIMIFLRCSNFARNGGNMGEVYKIFPWIGMHSLIRETSENQEIKSKSTEICKAIIFYFFFLYFVYYAIVLEISTDIFYQKTQQGLEQMLFGYIALIQFCAIVFMRTRPFLKYFPATHTMLMLLFIFYSQFATFGLKKMVCMIVCTASATLFAYMVLQLQIPGQTTWNRTRKYTPTADRPRIGMLPLFNLSWINNLPQEWTLLFPLFGRENFSQRQLAYVDRNFEELDQMFNNNAGEMVNHE